MDQFTPTTSKTLSETVTWRSEKRATVPRTEGLGSKLMLILAMVYDGIYYYELLGPRETVNNEWRLQFFDKLSDHWHDNLKYNIQLLSNNGRPHRFAYEASSVDPWIHSLYFPVLVHVIMAIFIS